MIVPNHWGFWWGHHLKKEQRGELLTHTPSVPPVACSEPGLVPDSSPTQPPPYPQGKLGARAACTTGCTWSGVWSARYYSLGGSQVEQLKWECLQFGDFPLPKGRPPLSPLFLLGREER